MWASEGEYRSVSCPERSWFVQVSGVFSNQCVSVRHHLTKNHDASAGAKPGWKISVAVKIVENRSKLLEQQEKQLEKIRHLGWISLQWWGIKGRGQSVFQHSSEEASSSCDSSPQRWRETKASYSTCKQQDMIPLVRHFHCIRQGSCIIVWQILLKVWRLTATLWGCDEPDTEILSGRRVSKSEQRSSPEIKKRRRFKINIL